MANQNYLNDLNFLLALDEKRNKEFDLKIIALTWNEEPIKEIQGYATGGTLNVDGASSMRRSVNFSMVTRDDYQNLNELIAINRKFDLYVGFKNDLTGYKHYDPVVWIPLGRFIMINPTINIGTNGTTITISAKDKTCLLNGEVGGKITAPITLHEKYRIDENDEYVSEKVLVFQIIQELVHHLGEEPLSKIIINDVDLKIKQRIQYKGAATLYYDYSTRLFSETPPAAGRYEKIKTDDIIGYKYVDFVYPQELVYSAGATVAGILDTIKNTLGNFEYFYDVRGNFIFQEKKNYLNTSYTPVTQLNDNSYLIDFSRDKAMYDFANSVLPIGYTKNPNYQNIKNDFVVWGKQGEKNIRYHLAIDEKPKTHRFSQDWRTELLMTDRANEELGFDVSYYYPELDAEWEDIYDIENDKFFDIVETSPNTLDFFLDFIDDNSELGEFSVRNIGRRSEVAIENAVNCVYDPYTPDVIVLNKDDEDYEADSEELMRRGQPFAIVNEEFYDALDFAPGYYSAYSYIRNLLYEKTKYNDSITIASIPVYYLEPNNIITAEDKDKLISGEYVIRSISYPLTYNGQMNINAYKALSRI